MLIITWTHYVRRAQRAYMKDIYEQVEMDTLSGVRAYMVIMYLPVEMYGTIFDDFIRINENGTYQITTCINFVTV